MRRAKALVAGLAALLAGTAAAAARPVIDSAGRTVEVPAGIAHVLPAGPPASVVLFALAPAELAGWIQPLSPKQRAFVPQRYDDLPAIGRLTGGGEMAPAELVRRAHADLIVDIGDVNERYAALAGKVQSETGVPYLLLDGSLAGMSKTLRTLGPLLDATIDAGKLADYVESAVAEARGVAARVPADKHPSVYYAAGATGLQTAAAKSGPDELLALLGARNVAAALGAHDSATLDQLHTWNPDVIVAENAAVYRIVIGDAGWQDLRAVRQKRVLLVPSGPFGWTDHPPSLNRTMGLRWLARRIYPGEFPDDLRAVTGEFYRLVYHQAPTAEQLDALLSKVPTDQP
jgi:iron complex transport system substrate-binding protein